MAIAGFCDNVAAADDRTHQVQRIGELMPLVLARYQLDRALAGAAPRENAADDRLIAPREFAIAPVGPRSMNSYTLEDTHCGSCPPR